METGDATVAPAVDSTRPDSTAGESAPPAIAADPGASESEADTARAVDDCRRKRFKTNRKAGC